ncbi:hypothetical protein IWX90DRAFT_207007 [Phyllosticta citrichinensis]|uniref:Uncharacterized protein n=1 Tax=Phyllosticta citrichinensis TaxID=1130410 RepID=A0ABR1XSK6_9PEZI
MEMMPPNALISPDEAKSLEFPPRLQIPQSTIHEINTPTPSPGSRSPVVPVQLNEAKPPEPPSQIQMHQSPVQQNDSTHHPFSTKLFSPVLSKKERPQNYHPPTVEDCEDADGDESAYPSTSGPASQRPSDSSVKSTSRSSTQPSVGSKDATANSPSPPTPPRNDGDFSPPKRADTDLLRTKKHKENIKEEIGNVKERIKEMEQQKNLENFREFCRRWSAEDALGVQQEFRPLPDPTRRTFFVKPSGKIVEKGGGVPLRDCKSKNPLHHEQRPTPPRRRSSTMDSFNSFHDSRSPRGNFSDINFNGHNTESPRTEAHRAFRYQPPVGSSARYMPSSYGATSNGSSGYTPTAYGSPGYERWNNSTNSFDSPSLGSPGYFSSSSYNPTHLVPSSYGSYGPFSHEPSSYNYSTSNPNDYDRSAASSYDSYDGYAPPHHSSPFTNTTDATSTDLRYVPSSADTSSTQPFFNVSPRSSTSLTPIPSPTDATTEQSPVPIPTTSPKGKEIFNDWIDSRQPTQNSRHHHRSHRNRNVEPESLDRDRYPPPLPPKEVDTEARAGRSGGTGSRRLPNWGAFRR